MAGAAVAASGLIAAMLFIPGVNVAVGVPVAIATLSGAGYAGIKLHTDNDKLNNADELAKKFNEVTKETVEIIKELDPSKIDEAINSLHQSVKNKNIEAEALEYYFTDVLNMARENLNEINHVIKRLRDLLSTN